MAGSVASSQRSSVYKAAVLEAQAETQRALAGLASTRAECNEQHQAIADNLTAVQLTVGEGLQISDQLGTARNMHNVRVNALGKRLGEMNDLSMAPELRVETQINDLSNQMPTIGNAINFMREMSRPRQPSANEGVQVGGSNKAPEQPNPARAVKSKLMSAMKPSTSKPETAEVR